MQQKTKQNKKVKRLIHNETIWQHSERVTYNKLSEVHMKTSLHHLESKNTRPWYYLLLRFLDSWTADGNLHYGAHDTEVTLELFTLYVGM